MKNQTIKREHLAEIYDVVCQDWKNEITKLVLFQSGNEISVEEEMLQKAYSQADVTQKALLEKYFNINTPKKLMDKIKNFDDILNIAGKTLEEVIPYKNPKTKTQKSINAYAKLQLVQDVLNEGFVFDFKNSNQYKYFPYFKHEAQGGWVCYDYGNYGCYSSCAEAAYFKTSELAMFAGKTFLNEYKEFLDRY